MTGNNWRRSEKEFDGNFSITQQSCCFDLFLFQGIVLSLDTGCVLFQDSPKSTLELAEDLETFLQMNWPINAHQNNPKLKETFQYFNQNLITKTETNVKGKSVMEKDSYFRLFSKTAMFELRNRDCDN